MSIERPSIIVTGANGQLGRCLQKLQEHFQGFDFHFLGREHLPVDNHELTRQVISSIKPFGVINTAAYTAVDKAEAETELANSINGYAAGNLAKHCAQMGARFLHVSTDYVFDGKGNMPHTETDETLAVNAYGASKLLGEGLVIKENADALIIRTSWVYSAYGNNFVKTMRRLFEERNEVKVVNDQYGGPTFAMDLAHAILQIITGTNWVPGIYHYCNAGIISWFEFAQAIKETGNYNCLVTPITTQQFPTPARRPAYSALSCQKMEDTFGIVPPDWKEALERYFQNNG